MKKIFIALVTLLSLNFAAQAQTKAPTQTKPAKTQSSTKVKTKTRPSMTYDSTHSNKMSDKPYATTNHVKKDGTPDRRYKENKK